MRINELIKRALFYISVPKCVLCKDKLDYDDGGLCKSCLEVYNEHKQRNCPNCSQILSRCSCSYDYLESHGIRKLIKLFRYSKSEQSMPSNYLIYSLKQDNRDDVLDFLSDELVEALNASIEINSTDYVITNVPRRRKAIIDFGYDHSKDLAVLVARKLKIQYVEILASKSKKAQKTLYGHDRVVNAKFEYKCKDNFSLKGKNVILVDDIVTTGASMTNSATLIKGLRPKQIIGACLGTAYKEKYIDFDRTAFK